MTRPIRACLTLALHVTGARAGDLHATYVTADEVALQRVLPPPPVEGSPAARADLDAGQAAVAARTADDERLIEADLPTSALRFADVLGPGFDGAAVPRPSRLSSARSRTAIRASCSWTSLSARWMPRLAQ